ncbi:MAG: hypothetical protein AAF907_07760, partial [Planctomycetota bacterium]
HGGGEGKTSGGRHPVSPWGKTEGRDEWEIDEAVLNELRQAKSAVSEILGVEEKFAIMVENYREMETDALSNTLRHQHFSWRDSTEWVQDIHHFDRRMVNLLTACRMYLDQVPQHLTAVDVGRKGFKKTFKENLGKCFDENFSYRFMEALRNYVQHRGLPVGSLYRNSWWLDSGETRRGRLSILELRLDKFALIEDKKVNPTLREEIEQHDGEIDLRVAAREYIAQLAGVHNAVRKTLKESYSKASSRLRDAFRAYNGRGKSDQKYFRITRSENGERKTEASFFDGSLRRYEMMVRSYRDLSDLGRSHVTSLPKT